MTNVTPERRDVAMVFQTYGLYPQMSIRDNIAFPLMLRKVPKAERNELVLDVAKLLGIADKLDRHPRALAAVSDSASRSRGRSFASHGSSFSTSPSATSMPTCAPPPESGSHGCTQGWGRHSST